ncbi:hypothetical protein CRG98_043693 [Punica granatum]|uniref:Uncharacterized protein n=1 Tax=Punica granatum TaxID=22663 RepID=A0A2I0HW30_PUNGR|nr:hypothetical protein CRG98_043693 [Punica granatum]
MPGRITEDWAARVGIGPRARRLGQESGDRGQRFPPLSAAATAREGTGDGGEYCLGYAALGRGVTRLGSVGIERDFGFLARVSSFPARDFPSSIAENRRN